MNERFEAVPAVTERDLIAARIGGRVRTIREERGWTPLETARRGGVAVVVVTDVEDGRRLPTIELLVRLAGALRVAPGDLLPSSDDKPRVDVHLPILDGPDSSMAQVVGGGPGNATQTYLYDMRAGESDGGFGEHRGEELLVVIEGSVVLSVLDRPDRIVSAGQSLVVETHIPHGIRVTEAGPARFLLVCTEVCEECASRQ